MDNNNINNNLEKQFADASFNYFIEKLDKEQCLSVIRLLKGQLDIMHDLYKDILRQRIGM